MKKYLLQISLLFLALTFFTSTALSQRAGKAVNESLINTTWQLYFKESAKESWTKEARLTFLQGGKLEVDGKRCPNASWTLKGKKLFFDFDEECCCGRGEGEVTVKGNRADGGGQLGMRGTPFIFRLVKAK